MTARSLGDFLLVVCAIPATLSIYVFSRVDWWKSSVGRSHMGFLVSLAVLLDLGVLRLVIGRHEAFEIVRLVAFAALPVVLWWQLWVLVRSQRKEWQDPPPV